MLLHVLDISGSEGRDPIDDFEKINKELAVFSEDLSLRPQIVVANKCDLLEDGEIEKYETYFKEKGYKFFPIMAAINEGTADLINCVAAELQKLPPILKYEAEPKPEVVELKTKRTFNINVRDDVYYVEDCDWLMDIMNTIDPDDYESLQYFERVLRQTGFIEALEKAGINEGDTVDVLGIEFDFVV